LNFITASVAVGPLLFGRLVWRPALQRWSERDDESDTWVTCLLRRLSLLGIGGLALATIGFVMVQAMQAGPGSLADTLKVLLAGRTGALLGARLGLLTLLAWLAWRLSLIGATSARVWSVAALLGSAILFTFSLQSHSAALDAGQAIVVIPLDWLHLVATATWMGGLLPLAFLLASGRIKQELRPLIVRRFSAVALLSVLTLGLTGLGSALIHVRTLDALVATTYGRALLVKSALFAILLGLGAINLLALSPRLSQGGAQALRWLRRTVRLEVAIGVLILLAVGVLTSVAPAFEALEAQERQGVVATTQFDNVQMTLRVAPAQVGENEFGVDIVDRRPGAAGAKPAVLLRFKTADQAMGTTQVETTSPDGRRFTAKGSYLSLSGQWQVTAILRREGFDDLTHTFHVSISATP
jgi:putative copper export protein